MLELKEYQDKYNLIYEKTKRLDKLFSIFRLISFLIIVLVFILGFIKNTNFYFLPIPIIIFVILCIIHLNITSNYTFHLKTIKEYEKRINKDIDYLEKSINVKNDLSEDLNLFNDRSIFQLINISRTDKGKKTLKEYLLNGNLNKERSSKLVNDLADFDFHLEFNEILKKNEIKEFSNQKLCSKNNNLLYFNLIFNFLAIILICLSFIISPIYGIISLVLNLLLVKMISTKYDFIKVTKRITNIYKYNEIIKFLKSANISNEYYIELTNFKAEKIKRIKLLDSLVSMSKNELLSLIFNAIFSLDSLIILLYKGINNESFNLEDISNNIGIIEALTSLSIIPLTNNISCIPEFTDHIDVAGMYHPMIKNSVLNDFSPKSNQILITGSNMSGKTTFMRTFAINNILANAGGMVLAKSFKTKSFIIKTSMVIKDNLYEGVSTFQSELKKLKNIITNLDDNKNYLILIDELFRGTNQIDRIKGAKYLISFLNRENIYLILSTHDLELFKLDLDIYHFEEEFIDDDLKFDYLLKCGPSNKTNAIKLMKMIGLDINE